MVSPKEIFQQYVGMRKLLESNGYTPQPHQQKWHSNPTRFLVAVCGRQVGKTWAAVNELINRATFKPNTRNWYITKDYKQAKRNVWDLLKKFCPPELHVKFNDSELKATFTNGSRIELIGVENAESLRGAVVNFMILDEYADFPRSIWPKVLRPMLSTTAGDVWFIGTPKGLGNDFYDKWIQSQDDSEMTPYKLPACSVNGEKVENFLSSYARADEIQNAFDTLPKDAFDQEYLADFTRPSGTVYSDWPLDNFKEVNYDVNLPLHITMDFGVNDPTSLIWIQPNGSEYRIIDYYEASDANIEHYISVIRSKPYKESELYTGDPAGKARALPTNTSPIEVLSSKGIHVRTKDGVKIPDQIRTVHGIIKSLFVSNKLTRFRDCLLNYRYPESSEFEGKRNQENEIPIHDEYSHAMRALEYYAVNVKDIQPEEEHFEEWSPYKSNKYTGYV